MVIRFKWGLRIIYIDLGKLVMERLWKYKGVFFSDNIDIKCSY